MSKLDGARPSSNIASRAGLARYRQLQEQTTGIEQSKQTGLPNGWFYNETKQEEFWQDLEGTNKNLPSDDSGAKEQEQNFNDITTCANRVQSLLSEFDALDQDTLMELMQIIDQDNNLGDIDQISFITDAKNNVLINIDELKEFAENQSALMNTIKIWLTNAQHSINIETNDPATQEELPNIDSVYGDLAEILQSYTEKSEKVAFLHNDVNEFWSKQTAQLKKIIYARDEEIRKLQATLQAALAAKQRKNGKKNKQSPDAENLDQLQTIEKQLRQIEEQKTQIEKLKNQLQTLEREKIIAQMGEQPNGDPNAFNGISQALHQKNLELESKNSVLNRQMEDLLNEINKMRSNLTNEKEKNSLLSRQMLEKDQKMGEMDILIQKYLNQLSLEKDKPVIIQQEDENMVSKEELYVIEMRYKEKIQEIKAGHDQELLEQAEMLEKKFQRERQLLLESIQSPDDKSALKSLIDEYDAKFENQKAEYNKMIENVKNNWASKVALLTRQYEIRINKLNTSHEFEIINAQNSVKYETKKVELEVTEKFNKDLLKMETEKNKKINSMQDDIDKKSDTILSLQQQLILLKQKLSKYESDDQPIIQEKNEDQDQKKEGENKSQDNDEVIRYAERFNNLKATLDEQHLWDLSMQKNFYDTEIIKSLDQKQKEIRNLLIDFESSIVDKEDETNNNEKEGEHKPISVEAAIEKVVSVLSSLNEQYESIKETNDSNIENEETLPLVEARKRTTQLTERIIILTNQMNAMRDEANSASTIPRLEELIQRLQDKIKFLESLQNEDQKKLSKRYDEMESKYLRELQFKDDLIKEMQNSIFGKKNLTKSEPENFYISLGESPNELTSCEYDYEEDLLSERRLSAHSQQAPQTKLPTQHAPAKNDNPVIQKPVVSRPIKTKSNPKNQIKQFRLKQQKHNLYDIETQISLDTPIVEAALKSILDHLTYNKCDSFTISHGIIDFKDSKSIPLRTVQLPKNSTFKSTAFKNKLYFSSVFAFHRDDNFVSFPIISEPSIQVESDNDNNDQNSCITEVNVSDNNSINNTMSSTSSITPRLNSTSVTRNNNSNNSIINPNNKSNENSQNNINVSETTFNSNNAENIVNNNDSSITVPSNSTDNAINNNNTDSNNGNGADVNSNNSNVNNSTANVSNSNTNANNFNANANDGNSGVNNSNANANDKNNNNEDEDTYADVTFGSTNFGMPDNSVANNNNNGYVDNSNSANNNVNNSNNENDHNFIKIESINSDFTNDTISQNSSNNVSSRRIMKRSRYVLCSIVPVKPKPIVISADENQMKVINELQEKLKEMNNDSRKKFLNDIIVECSNRHISTITKLNKVVIELANIQQQVISQPTLFAIPDKPDPFAEYREHQANKIQQQMQMNASIQARMAEIQNRSRTPKIEQVSKNLSALELPNTLLTPNGSVISALNNSILSVMSSRSAVSKPEVKNVVKKREPIQFIPPPEEIIPDAKLLDDPFTEAIQVAIANMRYLAQLKDNENEILNTLRNDYTAYEAFLRASKLFNDNNASFINNLKDVKESLDKTIVSYDIFSKMQKGLLDLVRQSKKKAVYMAKLYNSLQKKVSEEKLSDQSKSLASIKVDDSPAFIFDKIGTVLDVVDKLEISMTAEESVNFSELKAKYEKMKPKDDSDLVIDKNEADHFLIKTQDFIEGLKKRQYSSSESSEVDKNQLLIEISQNEIRTIKKKLKKSNRDLEKAKRDLAYSEETINNYKDVINNLKDSLKNEKGDSEQTLLMYQAQIQNLRELLKSFDGYKGAAEKGDNSSSADETSSFEIISKIKKEVISMQTLLDTQTAELNDARSKIREMQITLNENEILINQLKHNLNESEMKVAEIDDKYRRQKDINIFKEADDIQKTKEKGNKEGIEKMQRKQLERAQADQEMLIKRIQELEKKFIKTKKELNKVTDENDELRMKFALKQYETMSSIVKLSVATQTIFRLVKKRTDSASSTPIKEKENEFNSNNNSILDESNNQNSSSGRNQAQNENENRKEDENNKNENNKNENNNKNEENNSSFNEDNNKASEKVKNDDINKSDLSEGKENNSHNNDSKQEHNIPLSNKRFNNSSRLDSSEIEISDMEWVEEEEEKADNYAESGVFMDKNLYGSTKSDITDDLFIDVHAPLILSAKANKTNRNKTYMLSDPSQKKKTPKPLNPQKRIIIPKADNDSALTIGYDEKHPYRPSSSMNNDTNSKGRKRPFTSSVNPPNYASIISKQQQPNLSVSATRMNTPEVGRVNTTRTLNSSNSNSKGSSVRLPPKIPSLQRPTTTAAIQRGDGEDETFDTLRITNIQFAQESNGKDVSRSPPIVDISSKTTIDGPLVTFSKNVRTTKSTENDEVKFLIGRLREKLKKLTKSNEKKDEIISDLNKKLSDLSIALSRAKIDIIREKDNETRARIRFENVNQRLAAAMNELVTRQDENSALRRQLIHLNNAALPAMPLLRRMQKAKDEQERINLQQKRARSLIEEKTKIIGNAADDSMKSHLKTMIKNSQDSLLRMEARRRYWQEVEKKQIVGALGALSLLSQDVPDLQQLCLPYTSIFRSMKTDRGRNQQNSFEPQIDENSSLNCDIEIVSLEKKDSNESKNKKSELSDLNQKIDNDDENEKNEEEEEDNQEEVVYNPLSQDMINSIMRSLSDSDILASNSGDDDDDDSS